MTSIDDLFYAKVMPEPMSGCWLWMGEIVSGGYGRYQGNMAHRHFYEQIVGPIPEGLVLDHLCRQTCCVNPDHLEPVTNKENTLRGIGPSARNARKLECSHGHAFTPENTFFNRGRRYCRVCQRHFSLQNYYRNRAKALQGAS